MDETIPQNSADRKPFLYIGAAFALAVFFFWKRRCAGKTDASGSEKENADRNSNDQKQWTDTMDILHRLIRGTSNLINRFIFNFSGDSTQAIKKQKFQKQTRDQARRNLAITNQRAIGVCGTAKGGKSTLINGLRGLTSGSPGAIITDLYRSNTEIQRYDKGNTLIFELPSTDILTDSPEIYFEKSNMAGFDELIIVTGPMLREKDLVIADMACQHDIECIFVRSACDKDLHPILQDETEQDDNKRKLKQTGIRMFGDEFKKFPELRSLDPSSCCYFVSKACFEPTTDEKLRKQLVIDEDRLFQKVFNIRN